MVGCVCVSVRGEGSVCACVYVWGGSQRCTGLSVFVADRRADKWMNRQRDGGTEGPNDRQREGLKKTSSQKRRRVAKD